VKAFGGVLNGLDGNLGPEEVGTTEMNARVNQLWRFPFLGFGIASGALASAANPALTVHL